MAVQLDIHAPVAAQLFGPASPVTHVIDTLDRIGFDVGHTRVSVWGAIVVIVVVGGVLLAAQLGSKIATRVFGKITQLDPGQQVLGEKLVSIGVWVVAFLVGIDILGIDLTALTVFSGAFGLAVGFGLQKTFGNLIAGIILLMDRSIKPGDVIAIGGDVNGTFGQVKKIGIRAVSVTTRDQREYLIPNENLMTNQVENWSYSSKNVRFQIPVGVAYSADMDLAESLMLKAARESKRVLKVPSPTVWMHKYGDSSVNFVIHCWINDPEEGLGNVRSDVLKRLWKLFAEHEIELPFPQRDLNLRDNEQFRALIEAIGQRSSQAE
ncbi:MAG: mechanosensitive ion channel [Sphingomonadales bacterium]|nr:mechanosensitive ion channel [Sphingomonadales bacterium]MDE2567557.1 mechanosensitive ion channel [Sphingomonadales bacterium]